MVYYVAGVIADSRNWPVWVGGLVFLVTALICVIYTMGSIRRAEEAKRQYEQARAKCVATRDEYRQMIGDIIEKSLNT